MEAPERGRRFRRLNLSSGTFPFPRTLVLTILPWEMALIHSLIDQSGDGLAFDVNVENSNSNLRTNKYGEQVRGDPRGGNNDGKTCL